MTTMIKVEHVKTHKVALIQYATFKELKVGTNNVLVTDAELILIDPNVDVINTLTSHGKLATAFKEFSIETGKNYLDIDLWWKRSETKLLGVPILISRTEKIMDSDWYINGNTKASNHKIAQCLSQKEVDSLNKIKELMDTPNFPNQVITAKILALPEHFSPQQLQDIVDGKLKEGKCLVECENKTIKMDYHEVDSRGDYKWYCPKCGKGGSYMGTGDVHCHESNCIDKVIKLNPHITIYPVEEKMYTRDAIQLMVADFVEKCFDENYIYSSRSALKNKIKDWFEQNVK